MNNRAALVAKNAFLALVALLIAAPLVVVFAVSFNDTRRMSFPPKTFSFRWYDEFLTDPGWIDAVRASVSIGVCASLVALLVALPIAYTVWRYNSRAGSALSAAGSALFLLPGVVTALMLSSFWGFIGHIGRIENVVLGHAITLLGVPLAMLSVGFASIDKTLVEAAHSMGANQSAAFRHVIAPLIAPYIMCAFIFAFVFSINEYLIAYMVAGFVVETLPIRIFTNMRTGFEPTMCVGAVLFMALGFLAFSSVARAADLPKLLGRTRPIPT